MDGVSEESEPAPSQAVVPFAPPWLRPALWVVVGFGFGLLFHRYALLPFVAHSQVIQGLLWVSVGLLAAVRALLRRAGPDPELRRVTPTRLGLGVGGALVALGLGFVFVPPLGFLRTHVRRLPGFQLELPAGEEDATGASEYTNGRLNLKDPGGIGAVVQINWSPGERLDDQTTDTVIEVMSVALGTPLQDIRRNVAVVVPEKLSSRSFAARAGDAEMWLTAVVCGTRRVTVATSSAQWGVERLHRHVVGSFQCHPNPQSEAKADVPIVLSLGSGWHRVPSDPGQLQLTNGSELVMAQAILGTDPEKIVDTLKGSHVLPGIEIGARDGDRWPLQMHVEGGSARGWMRARSCAPRPTTLLLWWLPFVENAHEGETAIVSARCRTPGEPAQVWPEAAKAP